MVQKYCFGNGDDDDNNDVSQYKALIRKDKSKRPVKRTRSKWT
jgi:hypothetical protein